MRVLIAIMLVAATAALLVAADDDGKVSWAKGYPKAGAKAGQVLVKATAKPQNGYTLTSAKAVVWPAEGGEVTEFMVELKKDGTIGEAVLRGLASASKYNVTIDVVQSRNGQEQVRRTEPVIVMVP
jgi:hypothetical protein